MSWPFLFFFFGQSFQKTKQSMVKSLTKSVTPWVVWTSGCLLNPIEFTERPDNFIIERFSLIAVYSVGNPISMEPFVHQKLWRLLVPFGWMLLPLD